ncbi:ImmA/IrrE family metallo-endopeptidase [Campylobacter jejuni]|uniref:ImmA/IrrE family metallo-endopeptidase n=1 Tax=Campylobacter jejuni TaxID=197 RepID=UPI000B29B719|nr:ImmA/IrrE family metallo-endopeptidase [Campylobacter jejuni]
MTYKEIKDKTPYEILDLLEMKEPPFNPFEIAQKLGINVVKDLDLDKIDTEGQISIDVKGKPVIWINPFKNENRQRFTLAHELGYLTNDILPI